MNHNHLRGGLPPLPPQMRSLPVDAKTGFPVPQFVFWKDGVPDFRVSDVRKMLDCVKGQKCMICNKPLAGEFVFAMPPVNALNLSTDEPPMHWACAEWSAQVCPWLLNPNKRRNESRPFSVGTTPASARDAQNGISYDGAASVWMFLQVDVWWLEGVTPERGMEFRLGPPSDVRWYTQGRRANRDEAMDAMREAYQRQMAVTPKEFFHVVDGSMENFGMWLPEAE